VLEGEVGNGKLLKVEVGMGRSSKRKREIGTRSFSK
jgi:hypothetical protein